MSDAANASLARAYDQLPYRGHAFPDTHPDNLRTRAQLAGLDAPPPVTNCRVLEIGCGIGTNLLPMAQTLPDSRFVGIDISTAQIEVARKSAHAARIRNIELRCQDLLHVNVEDEKPFDFIIAHGFYSWVPPVVRDKLLLICRQLLSATGIAYVSYNTLPGWRLKQIGREMMQFHARQQTEPAAQLRKAREAMAFAAQPCPAPLAYKDVVARLRDELEPMPDWYLLHEQLGTVNEPVYFEQFISHVKEHALNYVGSATSRREMSMPLLAPAVRQQIESLSTDPIAREQYLDFLTGKMFRQSVLCRDDAPRADPARFDALEMVGRLLVAGQFTESTAPGGQTPAVLLLAGRHNDNRIALTDAGEIDAFRAVHTAWPYAVPVSSLAQRVRDTRQLAERIWTAFHAGIVELWSRPTDFLATNSTHPRVTPLARLQAAGDEAVVNLCHEEVTLDAPARRLLALLDGSRTHSELAASAQVPGPAVDQLLRQCVQTRMLCPS
jgi:SAM-dependent methyltransferase